jgi:hypothetical protein
VVITIERLDPTEAADGGDTRWPWPRLPALNPKTDRLTEVVELLAHSTLMGQICADHSAPVHSYRAGLLIARGSAVTPKGFGRVLLPTV